VGASHWDGTIDQDATWTDETARCHSSGVGNRWDVIKGCVGKYGGSKDSWDAM
jgi:hypothetical protein